MPHLGGEPFLPPLECLKHTDLSELLVREQIPHDAAWLWQSLTHADCARRRHDDVDWHIVFRHLCDRNVIYHLEPHTAITELSSCNHAIDASRLTIGSHQPTVTAYYLLLTTDYLLLPTYCY